jgi:hypothetical protein
MAIVGIALIGCGGGGDDESLTKAEYVKEANAICRKALNQKEKVIAEATEKLPDKVSASTKEKVVLEAFAPYEKATEELAELGKPEGQEEKAEALVEAMEDGAEKVKASPTTLLVSDLPVRKANKMAEDFGVDRCRF